MKSALIFGCGKHMVEQLMPVLVCHDKIRPVWCHDLDRSKSEAVGRVFSLASVSSDQLGSIHPDLVISAVRPTSTMAVLETAKMYGAAAFVEKPGGENCENILRLWEFAQQEKLDVWFGFNYRQADVAHAVIKFSTEHHVASAEYNFYSKHPAIIENNEDSVLECWLRGNAVHLFDFISFVHGDIQSTRSVRSHSFDEKFFIDTELLTASGAVVRCQMGNACSRFDFRGSLISPCGSKLEFDGFNSAKVYTGEGMSEVYRASTFNKVRKKDGFYQQFTEFDSANGATDTQFSNAMNAMRVCEEILDSLCVEKIDYSVPRTLHSQRSKARAA